MSYWIQTEFPTIAQRKNTGENQSNGTIPAKPAGKKKDANNLASTTFDRNQSGMNISAKTRTKK